MNDHIHKCITAGFINTDNILSLSAEIAGKAAEHMDLQGSIGTIRPLMHSPEAPFQVDALRERQ